MTAILTGLLIYAYAPSRAPAAEGAASLPQGFVETTIALFPLNAFPTATAFLPDGRILVTQKYGQLRMINNGSLLSTPVLQVNVNGSNERGLLGVAVDPAFSTNGHIYIYYTTGATPVHNRVSRFTLDGDTAVAGSELVLVELEPVVSSFHNAGGLQFSADGKLYISVGNDTITDNSQSLENRLGKLLRINKDGSIPTDNPFYATATGANRSIWAYGLRNPWRFAVQPGTGRIFINDVGFESWEEINEGVAGANYGFPHCEGFCLPPDPRYRDPILAYAHGNTDTTGFSITGGAFYNPPSVTFPSEYEGKYFFSDFVNGWIRTYDPASGAAAGFASGIPNLVDLTVGPDGALYYVTLAEGPVSEGRGALRKIQYAPSQIPQIGEQPADQTVSAGESATFEVRASGEPPLSYQWQKNGTDIPGANSSTYTTPAVDLAGDGALFRCIVTNKFGSIASDTARLSVTANQQPVPTITSPAAGTTYAGGDTITFAGSATDPEDGMQPASAFSWHVDFHHADHVHPGYLPSLTGVTSGSFNIATIGETSTDVWYRLYLTVKDADGATATVFRDIRPRTATITLATNPPGLSVTLDGQPQTAPYSNLSVVGIQRSIGVVSPQFRDGTTYEFSSWSDGGAVSHTIASPETDTTYTATLTTGTTPPALAGCGPGFWKNHPQAWPVATATALDAVFDIPDSLGAGDSTLLSALDFRGGPRVEGGSRILLRAGVAAYLNAAHPQIAYPLPSAEVVAQVNAALASGDRGAILDRAQALGKMNDLGCPNPSTSGVDAASPG